MRVIVALTIEGHATNKACAIYVKLGCQTEDKKFLFMNSFCIIKQDQMAKNWTKEG